MVLNNIEVGGADLHLHSSLSDGLNSPRDVVKKAHKARLEVISLTDHDTVAGIPEAIEAATALDIEIIPGIELSCSEGESDIHILGYFIDHKNSLLLTALKEVKDRRLKRMETIIDKLNKLGLIIDRDDFFEQFGEAQVVGRLHLANYMLEKKLVSSIHGTFNQYLGNGKPGYENIKMFTLEEGIDLIKESGGVAVYAHPYKKDVDTMIPKLTALGIEGIEIYYPGYSEADKRRYLTLANKMGLIPTGGSDDHGDNSGDRVTGKIRVPLANVALLRELAQKA